MIARSGADVAGVEGAGSGFIGEPGEEGAAVGEEGEADGVGVMAALAGELASEKKASGGEGAVGRKADGEGGEVECGGRMRV